MEGELGCTVFSVNLSSAPLVEYDLHQLLWISGVDRSNRQLVIDTPWAAYSDISLGGCVMSTYQL
jgi:hypothetical protein